MKMQSQYQKKGKELLGEFLHFFPAKAILNKDRSHTCASQPLSHEDDRNLKTCIALEMKEQIISLQIIATATAEAKGKRNHKCRATKRKHDWNWKQNLSLMGSGQKDLPPRSVQH